MRRNRIGISIIAIFLLMVCLTGCQKTKEEQEAIATDQNAAEEIEEMVVAVNVDSSENVLPFESVLLNRSKFWGSLIFQGLLVADDNINNVKTDLCEEYTILPDGKTYVFTLADGLYWHDGEKLTTEDVVFSIETCLRSQEVNGYMKKGIEEILGSDLFESGEMDSVVGIMVDGNNITIKTSNRNDRFLGTIAQLPILPKHCLEDVPIEELGTCDFWKMPIGSGPYKVISNKGNKEAVLVLNDKYSKVLPKIKQIRYKVLENPETDYFDFAITSNPDVIRDFQSRYDYTTIKTGNLYYRYLYFNLDGRSGENKDLLKNKRVRQALAMAIDRESIIHDLYRDAATPMESGIPAYDDWYDGERNTDVSYNPKIAKSILESEGFDFSKTLVLTRYNQDDLSVKLLEAIAKSWNAIGVKTDIQPIAPNETNKLWVDADWYDVGLKNLAAVDYSEWYYEYSSHNTMWSVVLHDRPVFDVLISALDGTRWAYERKMLYEEIQEMEAEQMFKIPLAIVPQHIIYNSSNLKIPNITFPNLYYYYDLKLTQWELVDYKANGIF